MKQVKAGFFAIILLLGISFWAGCNSDPCKDVDCQNGGQCLNGTCFCPDGFSGEFCQEFEPCDTIECENNGNCVDGTCNCVCGYSGTTCSEHITDPFTGVFTVSRNCDGVSELYTSSISRSNTTCDGILIGNFYNTGSSVFGTVSLTNFAFLPVQSFDTFTIQNGSVSVNGTTGVLTITYDIEDQQGASSSCVATFTPS